MFPCVSHMCLLAAFKYADAEGESGPVWPVEELRWLSGSRGRPLWLVYPGESVRNLKRFLSPQNSIYHVNCALSQLPRPLLPDRANLISVRFSVMHMPHAFWRNLADNATVLSVGSGAAVAVWVSDGFRLKLISKPGKMRLMGRRNEFSIYKHSNQGNDWDSFVGFHPLHSQFKSSHQCELSVISGFSTPVACFSFSLGVERSSLLLW